MKTWNTVEGKPFVFTMTNARHLAKHRFQANINNTDSESLITELYRFIFQNDRNYLQILFQNITGEFTKSVRVTVGTTDPPDYVSRLTGNYVLGSLFRLSIGKTTVTLTLSKAGAVQIAQMLRNRTEKPTALLKLTQTGKEGVYLEIM